MDQYSTLLEKAEIASEGNPLLESRIRRVGLGLDYTYLQQARFYGPHRHGIFEQDGEHWVVRPNVSRKVTQFIKDAKRLGVIELAEGGASPDAYAKEWSEIFNAGVRMNKASQASIKLKNPFDPSFPANGLETLSDSVPGYMDYSYNWLLWNGEPMDITFDFEQEKHIYTIELNFLKDARHWIFSPKEVRISVSQNGEDFQDVLLRKLESQEEDYTVEKVRYRVLINDRVKVIRVYAEPLAKLPEWRYHPKRNALIACDEIWIN